MPGPSRAASIRGSGDLCAYRGVMARSTSTPTNARASAKGSSTRARKPAPAPTKYVDDTDRPPLAVRAWLGVAHAVGGMFRAFGLETLEKDQRRDGFPFLLVVLAALGAVNGRFFIGNDAATQISAYTVGLFVGRVAFIMPVPAGAGVGCSGTRRPSTTTGASASASDCSCSRRRARHVAGGRPQPSQGMPALSAAGGLFALSASRKVAAHADRRLHPPGCADTAEHSHPHQDPAQPHRPSSPRPVRVDVRAERLTRARGRRTHGRRRDGRCRGEGPAVVAPQQVRS